MTNFFDLPREIRDQVYALTLSYPDVDALIAKAHHLAYNHHETYIGLKDRRPKATIAQIPYPPLTTPTILLLNHQITEEALETLHKQTWTLSVPVVSAYHIQGRGPDILNFISEGTLQTIRKVVLSIDFQWGHGSQTHAWYLTIEMLLDSWYQANCIESIRVVVSDPPAVGSHVQAFPEWKTAGDVIAALQSLSFDVNMMFEGEVDRPLARRRDTGVNRVFM